MTDAGTAPGSPHPASRAAGRAYLRADERSGPAHNLLDLDPGTDLRTLPTEPEQLRSTWLGALLAPGRLLDLDPFLERTPLGPLADVAVYATDLPRHGEGESHAPGLCHLAPSLTDNAERLTLAELLPIYTHYRDAPGEEEARCALCGGYAFWRLDDAQLAHYLAAGPHPQ